MDRLFLSGDSDPLRSKEYSFGEGVAGEFPYCLFSGVPRRRKTITTVQISGLLPG
jgi:hypothetical protein